MKQKAVIVFVKNPEPGKVKTKLAKDIGDTAAADAYKLLLQHTHDELLSRYSAQRAKRPPVYGGLSCRAGLSGRTRQLIFLYFTRCGPAAVPSFLRRYSSYSV